MLAVDKFIADVAERFEIGFDSRIVEPYAVVFQMLLLPYGNNHRFKARF